MLCSSEKCLTGCLVVMRIEYFMADFQEFDFFNDPWCRLVICSNCRFCTGAYSAIGVLD